jgi:hypothetical protein
LAGGFNAINIWDLKRIQCQTHCLCATSIFIGSESTLSLGWVSEGSALLALLSNGNLVMHKYSHPSKMMLRRLKVVTAHEAANGASWNRGVIAVHTNGNRFATCCCEEIIIWEVGIGS